MKVRYIPGEDSRKLAAQNDVLAIYTNFSRDVPETENRIANSPNKTYSQSEVTLGTKTK